MRIAVDYTAAARQGGGIGRYTRELLHAALSLTPPHEFILLAGVAGLGDRWQREATHLRQIARPGSLHLRAIPLSDDWLARLWHRLHVPMVAELFTGRIDLFYAPDFLLPPLLSNPLKLVTIHDLSFLRHPETFPDRLRAYLESAVPRSARHADHILADSHCTRRDIIELLDIPSERVTTLHLGVTATFSPHPQPDERKYLADRYRLPQTPYILAVGTVQPRKNYDMLIRAVDLVRRDVEADLVIAGQLAWMSESVQAAAMARPYVHLLGFVADEDLPALYRQAAAFAFPSIYEGFGLPPLEAMATGTPVVASTASSIPEAVGDAGLLVDPSDTDRWAYALASVLTDEALRQDLCRRGQARAKLFSWKRTAQEWLDLVASLER